MDIEVVAHKVLEAARKVAFNDTKDRALIFDVCLALETTPKRFGRLLCKMNQKGLIKLHRHDLPGAVIPTVGEERFFGSEITHMNAEFHCVECPTVW